MAGFRGIERIRGLSGRGHFRGFGSRDCSAMLREIELVKKITSDNSLYVNYYGKPGHFPEAVTGGYRRSYRRARGQVGFRGPEFLRIESGWSRRSGAGSKDIGISSSAGRGIFRGLDDEGEMKKMKI